MITKKILLAEDDVDDRDFFHDFLCNRKDIELLPIVENGEEIIQYLESLSDSTSLPDVIILDQNMPKRSGLNTLQYIKENKRYTHISVVIYSTYADENLIEKSYRLGANSVITKPTNMEGYHKMIDEVFMAV